MFIVDEYGGKLRVATKTKKVDIETFQGWITEATFSQQMMRAEMWTDAEFVDGVQNTYEQMEKAEDAGMKLLTINRIFPVTNMLRGLQASNPLQATAKGRTKDDTEAALALSEGIQFVYDQYEGEFVIATAFGDQIIPGIGWLHAGFASDPRKERVRIAYRDWKEIWWDPFASPWLDPEHCRYAFQQRWMDLEDLVAMFPERESEIRDMSGELSGHSRYYGTVINDEAQQVEDLKRMLTGSGSVDSVRNRVRPAEIWYTVWADGLFAVYRDGKVLEVDENKSVFEQYEMVRDSQQLIKTTVKKMRVATILGELILQDIPTPFPHHEFPFIPFIGYLDRNNNPYGVVRQMRDMNIEVNERRSMALALLSKKQIIAESSTVDKPEKLQNLYEEGQKPDGMLVVQPGTIDRIRVVEHGAMAQAQVNLMQQSEGEIQQISGANAEQMGYRSNATSGTAIDKRQQQSTIINASLFQNTRRSLKKLGEQTACLIQGEWTQEKILRITDRLTGSERFIEVNKRVEENGVSLIKNDITTLKADIVISDAPLTDTVREKNMDMIIEWVKKSPPEIIPHLMNLAFELSSIPNKEILLQRIKPILGIDPTDEDLTSDEIKEKAIQKLKSQAEEAQKQGQFAEQQIQLQLQNQDLLNQKLMAEIENLKTKPITDRMKADAAAEKVQITAYKTGADVELKKGQAGLAREKAQYEAYRDGDERAHEREVGAQDLNHQEQAHQMKLRQGQELHEQKLEQKAAELKEKKSEGKKDDSGTGSKGGQKN